MAIKGRTHRQVTKNRAAMMKAISEGKTTEEVARIGGLSLKNPSQSVHQALKPMRPVVLSIIAEAGMPIEKLFKDHLIPKLTAKKTQLVISEGIVMSREEIPDNDIQAKVALEIAKMTGCYVPEKIEMDVSHTYTVDMGNASDDDIARILALAAASGASRNQRQGRVLPQEPIEVAAG
jgi:hypothetical protein